MEEAKKQPFIVRYRRFVRTKAHLVWYWNAVSLLLLSVSWGVSAFRSSGDNRHLLLMGASASALFAVLFSVIAMEKKASLDRHYQLSGYVNRLREFVAQLADYTEGNVDSIRKTVESLSQVDAPKPSNDLLKDFPEDDRPIGTKERNTLLTIIAVLCNDAKLDYRRPAKTAGLIQGMAASMGVSIGETTIENHLKKIPSALETRMK